MAKIYVESIENLLVDWDYEKNSRDGYFPNKITFGSTIKVWWKCKHGHSWQASPNNRSKGQGCPVCSGKKILVGYNDLRTLLPDVAAEWHPEKNMGLTPEDVTHGSHKLIWWKCSVCQHEWKTSVSNRAAGKGCPACALQKQGKSKVENIIKAAGSFFDHHPELLDEWDYERNNISPEGTTANSTMRVWWKCRTCGYSWRTSVYHRTIRNSGCPYCKNKAVSKQNCLHTKRPDLLAMWDYEANSDISPFDITPGSNKKVGWICKHGHKWQATVTAIANGGQCPVCCGQKVLPGFNDLATTAPELVKEWHPTRNGNLTPKDITKGSVKHKIWWLCPRGHEYQATAANRSNGTRCPICDKEQKTSFPEQAILYYFKKHTSAISRYLLNGKTEIDIYLPDLQIGIEYDGYYFHSSQSAKAKEAKKDIVVKTAGITLFRVKEYKNEDEIIPSDSVIYCRHTPDYEYLTAVMKELADRVFEISGHRFSMDVDIARDSGEIFSQYIEIEKENSLAARNLALAVEWHPTKNGYLSPETVSYASGKVVWWQGECGHEWRSSIGNRNHGNGCPICAGFQILVGYNDLATTHPLLCKEWHPTKNGNLTPEMVTKGSHKKIWWICPKGHEYDATASNRIIGRDCPICSVEKQTSSRRKNHVANTGSLAETHPQLATEWDTSTNKLRPEDITSGSDEKVWWICPNGHRYEATVANRSHGRNCPICAGKKIVPGINDLLTRNQPLAAEWNYEKNQELDPSVISPNSHKKAWWRCQFGHEWEAEIKSRNQGNGCPICRTRKKKTI